MQSSQSTATLDLADGPTLADNELGVHLIYVPESCAAGYSGANALSQIVNCIGTPDPTDVIVYGGQPWHYAGLAGHKKQLWAHPKVHETFRATILAVDRLQDQKVVWWSETPFTDVTIALSKHPSRFYPPLKPLAQAPPTPFSVPLEVNLEPWNGRSLYVVRSTVPVDRADTYSYKIAFYMNGDAIDPDMYCGAP